MGVQYHVAQTKDVICISIILVFILLLLAFETHGLLQSTAAINRTKYEPQNYSKIIQHDWSSFAIMIHIDIGQFVLIALEAMWDLLAAYPACNNTHKTNNVSC